MCYKEGDIKQDIKIEKCNCNEKGNCVLNYLEERLGQSVKNKKIPAKLMNRSYLNGFFIQLKRILDSMNPNPTNMNEIMTEEDFVVDEIDWEAKEEIDGITPYMLYLFCKQFNLSHICISAIGEIIGELRYVASESRPALIYMTNGYHLYPIKDHHEKRKIIERFKYKTINDAEIFDFEKDRDNPIINHLVNILQNEKNKNLHNPYYIKGYFTDLKRQKTVNNNIFIELSLDDIKEEKYINNLKPEDISNFCRQFDIQFTCYIEPSINKFPSSTIEIKASDKDRPKIYMIYQDELYFIPKENDVSKYKPTVLPVMFKGGKEPKDLLIRTFKKPTSFGSLQTNIKNKLRSYEPKDIKLFERIGNISVEDVEEMLRKQNNICALCNEEVLLKDWLRNCCYQFSIDRIDNDKPHDKDNCRITCYFCNCKRAVPEMSPYKVCMAGCHREIKFIEPSIIYSSKTEEIKKELEKLKTNSEIKEVDPTINKKCLKCNRILTFENFKDRNNKNCKTCCDCRLVCSKCYLKSKTESTHKNHKKRQHGII